ncbi:MAG: hypothetical protein U0795_13030 [Pirellulales bacterium]
MARLAHVESVDAIERFRGQLIEYRRVLVQTAEALAGETERVSEWLERDRQPYWLRQRKLAERDLTEAQANYSRCMTRTRADQPRSCFSEKKILEKCRQRLREVNDRLARLKEWRRQLDRECELFKMHIRRLLVLADDDLARAALALQRVHRYLSKYVQLELGPAVGTASAVGTGSGQGTATSDLPGDLPTDSNGSQRRLAGSSGKVEEGPA